MASLSLEKCADARELSHSEWSTHQINAIWLPLSPPLLPPPPPPPQPPSSSQLHVCPFASIFRIVIYIYNYICHSLSLHLPFCRSIFHFLFVFSRLRIHRRWHCCGSDRTAHWLSHSRCLCPSDRRSHTYRLTSHRAHVQYDDRFIWIFHRFSLHFSSLDFCSHALSTTKVATASIVDSCFEWFSVSVLLLRHLFGAAHMFPANRLRTRNEWNVIETTRRLRTRQFIIRDDQIRWFQTNKHSFDVYSDCYFIH